MAETTVLEVRGMTCGNCVKHVENALRAVPGVSSTVVTLASGEVSVTHDPGVAPASALVAAIEEEGYAVTSRGS